MPKRYTPRMRVFIYRILVERDGEMCQNCEKMPPGVNLEIDHIDGDRGNDDAKNLRLLCKSCNVADGNRRRNKGHIPSGHLRERERDFRSLRTVSVRSEVEFEGGSAEMRANNLYEVPYIHWLIAKIEDQGEI